MVDVKHVHNVFGVSVIKEKELLFSVTKDDFEITTFSGTGKGGQNRNKKQKCVRLKHKDTGIITVGQNERSLEQNKKSAFMNMVNHPDFKKYMKLRTSRELGEVYDVEQKVEEAMKEENLKIEYV